MGLDLRLLAKASKISLHDLKGKAIAIDAYNAIHQFLSIIRQRDGTPLKDSEGNITSHLSGLLYRTANFVDEGIKPVYVFDGASHPLKMKTIERRRKIKEKAEAEWATALKKGDIKEAFKKAVRTGRIDAEMIDETKRLLDALGIPFVDAKGEGEAQASYMNIQGDVYGTVSQDFDSLLFGAPILIRNLAITGKRKLPDKQIWIDVSPEKIDLPEILDEHDISRENLVEVAILIGTDFNEGIRGIGPKRGLQLIKKYGNIENLIAHEKIDEIKNMHEVRKIFLEPEINSEYEVVWKKVDEKKVVELLCHNHQFSRERVNSALEKYRKFAKTFNQKRLCDY